MLHFFELLFQLIGRTLILDVTVWDLVATHPQSRWLVIGVIILAGISTLIGQSVVLFVNHVRKSRLLISLFINGLLMLANYVIWGVIIGLIGWLLFPITPSGGSLFRLIGLSAAPLVFGFLVLAPYIGTSIGKLLHVWSLIILISVVKYRFEIDFLLAASTVGLGWLILTMLNKSIGKPIIRLRNSIWQKTTGTTTAKTAQDILLDFSTQKLSSTTKDGS